MAQSRLTIRGGDRTIDGREHVVDVMCVVCARIDQAGPSRGALPKCSGARFTRRMTPRRNDRDSEPHDVLAERLRTRVLQTGTISAELREGAVAAGAGQAAGIPPEYDALARQIGEASYRVTDAQVEAARRAAGSDRAAFEVVLSASIGAGLRRWDAALRAIEGAADASA